VRDQRLPVIVGVGQLRNNRTRTADNAREPADLISAAIGKALADAGPVGTLLRRITAIDVVRVMSWSYDDLPSVIASRIGAAPTRTFHSEVGGNRPVELLDQAAGRIASGDDEVVVVCGGEATASLIACGTAGIAPPWSAQPGGPLRVSSKDFASPRMIRYGLTDPVQTYPLFENALRARLGQDWDTSQDWSAELYSAFSAVASTNDAAWDPVVRSAAEIRGITTSNRMICWPYPLLMNAQGRVDQASAVVVTSLGLARDLGVPPDKIVHVWGGAGASDDADVFNRRSFDHSPALDAVAAAVLDQGGITATDVGLWDFYSCFPVVPKLGIRAFGLTRATPVSVTGGLNSFGGPSNNYSGHALVAMVRALRGGEHQVGLVYGNGEHLTKHHVVLLSVAAHPQGYVGAPDGLTTDVTPPVVVDDAQGDARIETFTVAFDRGNRPERGWVIARLEDDCRCPAAVTDPQTLALLTDVVRQPIGQRGAVRREDDVLTFRRGVD
jgi:acetyl-CoA C-acetyltransferase